MIKKKANIINIRNSNLDDIPSILKIFSIGRQFQKYNGNPKQWTNNYPNKEILLKDINEKCSYVFEDSNGIYGTFMFKIGHDSSYDYVENGSWINNKKYGVIHRICSNNTHSMLLHETICFAKHIFNKQNNYTNIKIDTHKKNTIVQHILRKEGFIKIGTVYVDGIKKRIGYQYYKDIVL